MEVIKVVIEKLYWLVIASTPFFPWYYLEKLHERLACEFGSPCFEWGVTFMVEGKLAGLLAGLIIWPMCIWSLGGKFLWKEIIVGKLSPNKSLKERDRASRAAP